jgi:SAM-dependent methyltransferase
MDAVMQPFPGPWNAAWPIILSFIDLPRSVVDFGCGNGLWLAELGRLSPQAEMLGLNWQHRKDAGKFLRADQFRTLDLRNPIDLGRKFDLAICIEVAEHLPASAADLLIETITRHSDVVLFSAAIPKQGGEDHVNEQWPQYWIERFAKHDFACFDCLRPLLWNNAAIAFWYRQNMMLFMKPPNKPLVAGDDWGGYAIVHPELFGQAVSETKRPSSSMARRIAAKIRRAII